MSFSTEMLELTGELFGEFDAQAYQVLRNGALLGTCTGFMVSNKAANETGSSTSGMAQTSMAARTLILSAIPQDPLVGDYVTTPGKTYMVQAVDTVRPTDTTILYKLEVK
jgi:guanyl-specific ribonuclease Sa